MAELPEIVRQRLARQAAGEHPDPDLLTAFAEGLLTERERTRVLDHLGACATCREVVSLALPETPVQQPVPGPVDAGWLRWPVLRWGAVAAAVVIVGAAVILREPHRAGVSDGEAALSLPKPEVTAPAKTAEPGLRKKVAAAPPALDKESRAESKDVKEKTAAPKPAAPTFSVAPAAVGKKSEVAVVHKAAPPVTQAEAVQQYVSADAQPRRDQALAYKSQAQVTAAQSQAAGVQTNVTGGALQQKQDQLSTAQQQGDRAPGAIGGPMSRAKAGSSTTQQAEAAPMPARPQAPVQQNVVADERATSAAARAAPVTATDEAVMMKSALRTSPVPRWRVSSEGKVESSTDSGATWRMVPVKDGASFRALSAIGNDIWAAGGAGALYHSANGGQTWSRVTPREGEIVLTSDITRVEFTDPLHGVIATASGETWLTADGGRTWSVRRP